MMRVPDPRPISGAAPARIRSCAGLRICTLRVSSKCPSDDFPSHLNRLLVAEMTA